MINKDSLTSKLRVCYINHDTKILQSEVLALEEKLKQLKGVEIVSLSSIEGNDLSKYNLLIINAISLTDEAFIKWLPAVSQKITQKLDAQIPTIFLSYLTFSSLNQIWQALYEKNWYFDIIHPDHLESIPIRMANLLRIFDHLHEVKRYEQEIKVLQKEVLNIQETIKKLNQL